MITLYTIRADVQKWLNLLINNKFKALKHVIIGWSEDSKKTVIYLILNDEPGNKYDYNEYNIDDYKWDDRMFPLIEIDHNARCELEISIKRKKSEKYMRLNFWNISFIQKQFNKPEIIDVINYLCEYKNAEKFYNYVVEVYCRLIYLPGIYNFILCNKCNKIFPKDIVKLIIQKILFFIF